MKPLFFAIPLILCIATQTVANALSCTETALMPNTKTINQEITALISCFFELRLGEYSNRQMARSVSAAIVRKIYPDTKPTVDRKFVESAVRYIYQKQIPGADTFEMENAKGDLLNILESRYAAMFWEHARPLINQSKARAVDSAENAGFVGAGIAYLSSYLVQRRFGIKVRGLSQVSALIMGGSIFKLRYDQELARIHLEGIPPAPSEILGWNTEGLEAMFDENIAPNTQSYVTGLIALALFSAFEPPIRKLWNRSAKTRPIQKLRTRMVIPPTCRLLLSRWQLASPRSLSITGKVAKVLLHPVNIVSMIGSMTLSDFLVNQKKTKWTQESILRGLENVQLAIDQGNVAGQKLALRNLYERMLAYDNLLKQNELAKIEDPDSLAYAVALTKVFFENIGSSLRSAEWDLWTQQLNAKPLSDLRYPSELAIWLAMRTKRIGVSDVTLFTNHAEQEALNLISLIDPSNGAPSP